MTEDQLKEFTRMCVDTTMSYRDIAAHFPGMSRNAAIGRARRMGLADRRPIVGQDTRRKSAQIYQQNRRLKIATGELPPPKRRNAYRLAQQKSKPPPVHSLPAEPLPPPSCQPVDLMTVTGCRFPVDELFCNADRLKGQSYCPYHRQIAYRPPQPRKRAA